MATQDATITPATTTTLHHFNLSLPMKFLRRMTVLSPHPDLYIVGAVRRSIYPLFTIDYIAL